jgi:hypothetical protein
MDYFLVMSTRGMRSTYKSPSQDAEDFADALDHGRALPDELQPLLRMVQGLIVAGDEASTSVRLPQLRLKGDLKRRTLQAIERMASTPVVDVTPAGNTVRHGGTGSAYSNYGCRCVECTEANRARAERRRAERKSEGAPGHAHGSRSTYSNWSCRCGRCRSAAAVIAEQYRRSNKTR